MVWQPEALRTEDQYRLAIDTYNPIIVGIGILRVHLHDTSQPHGQPNQWRTLFADATEDYSGMCVVDSVYCHRSNHLQRLANTMEPPSQLYQYRLSRRLRHLENEMT